MVFFCVVLEVATLWQAQVEVNSALDATALAAVKDWGISGSGSTSVPRDVGVAYAAANPILGDTFTITKNYNPANLPNENASNAGNLVFGALVSPIDPITFNAGLEGGCAVGDVTITINKPFAGVGNPTNESATADMIEVVFDDGDPGLTIESIAFTLPTSTANDNQRPFFDASKDPQVSQVLTDYNGLNVAPDGGDWNCPNTVGDICFVFEDQIAALADRYQTVRLNFDPGSFTSTGVPATTDFFHFGVSTNALNPPAFPGQNDGDAWGDDGVIATVTFYNTISMTTSTASAVFVNTGGVDGISQATFSGAGGGYPAVLAQATVPVQGYCSSLFGVSFFNVSASSVAYYDCATNRSALVNVTNFIFP